MKRIPPLFTHGTLQNISSIFTIRDTLIPDGPQTFWLSIVYYSLQQQSWAMGTQCTEKNSFPPSVVDRDNAADVFRKLKERWHGHIEVRPGDVAPSSVVAGFPRIGWAKISCSYCDATITRQAPSAPVALDLEAGSAPLSVVEKDCAQSCCVGTISCAIQIAISTCTACQTKPTS